MAENITTRLASVQARLRAPKGQYNSFAKYHYRSAEDIIEAVKPLVHEQGMALTISDELVQVGDRYYVRATAAVSDGEQTVAVTGFAREASERKGMDDSQITGSASSYARKYALNGLFAIDDGKDADATQGQPAPARKATPKPAPEPSPLGEQDVVLRADADFSGDDQWQRASRSLHARAGDVVGRDDAHDVLHIMAELAGFSSLKAVPTKRLLTMREFIGGPKWTTYYTTEIEPALADLRLATTETE